MTQQKTTILSARQILKTLRGKKKKGVGKPQAVKMQRGNKKKQRKINQRYKIGARKQSSRTDNATHKRNFTRQK